MIRRAVAEMRQAWVLPEFRALVDPVLAEFCTARLLGIVAVSWGGNLSAPSPRPPVNNQLRTGTIQGNPTV